jgi:branched-chain amino acid transport system permease protein
VAFLISGAMTGLIGAMQTPLAFITAGAGFGHSLKGFIAAILGGFEQICVATVGGLLVGYRGAYVATKSTTSCQDWVIFSLLLILLIVCPAGLTPVRVSEGV